MQYEITPYINPKYPERQYYKATVGNETYHHCDRAIVDAWAIDQIKNYDEKLKKQCITERAINSFYKK